MQSRCDAAIRGLLDTGCCGVLEQETQEGKRQWGGRRYITNVSRGPSDLWEGRKDVQCFFLSPEGA